MHILILHAHLRYILGKIGQVSRGSLFNLFWGQVLNSCCRKATKKPTREKFPKVSKGKFHLVIFFLSGSEKSESVGKRRIGITMFGWQSSGRQSSQVKSSGSQIAGFPFKWKYILWVVFRRLYSIWLQSAKLCLP